MPAPGTCTRPRACHGTALPLQCTPHWKRNQDILPRHSHSRCTPPLGSLPPAGSSLVKTLSNGRSSSVDSPAALPTLAPVAVLAAEEAGGSTSITVDGARAAEGEAAAAMAPALPELLLMPAAGAGQVGARRAAAAPQAPVVHGCGAWRAPSEAAAVLPRWIKWRTGRAAAVFSVRPNSSEGAPAAMSCSGVASQLKRPSLQVREEVPHWRGGGSREWAGLGVGGGLACGDWGSRRQRRRRGGPAADRREQRRRGGLGRTGTEAALLGSSARRTSGVRGKRAGRSARPAFTAP